VAPLAVAGLGCFGVRALTVNPGYEHSTVIEPIAMTQYEIKNASAECASGVQIVSRPPDFFRPKVPYLNSPGVR
jgi:hypothetical protein